MGLTYDGITYRSLEEQVRYDAEQVQVLKQADVTINENLQTINTELNGKLTKPTNPSAESAVTLLANGTVGTKPLSEIGGGGGKLYMHRIPMTIKGTLIVILHILSSYSISYTLDDIEKITKCPIVPESSLMEMGASGSNLYIIYKLSIIPSDEEPFDIGCYKPGTNGFDIITKKAKFTDISGFSDTVTEL